MDSSLLPWLSLTPAVVALALWVRLWRRGSGRRSRETAVAASLLVLAGFLLAGGRFTGRERLVLITDTADPEAVDRALRRLGFTHSFPARLVRFPGDGMTGSPSRDAAWTDIEPGRAGGGRLLVPNAALAASPDEALRTAFADFAGAPMPWWRQGVDRLLFRRRRVVISTSGQKGWQAFTLPVDALASEARRLGVRVDVVRLEDLPLPAELDLRLAPSRVAADLPPRRYVAEVVLQLRSPALLQLVNALGPAGVPRQVQVKLRCQIDPGLAHPDRAREWRGVGGRAKWELTADGMLTGRVPISDLPIVGQSGPPPGLEAGFHLATASVQVVDPDLPALTAEGASYFEARSDQMGVIVGKANRLGAVDPKDAGKRVEIIRDAIGRLLRDGRWPASLSGVPQVGTCDDENEAGLIINSSKILVAHELDDAQWEHWGPILRQAVERGGKTLVVSAPPPVALQANEKVGWLPAFGEGAVKSRRPTLAVVFDDSNYSYFSGLVPTTTNDNYVTSTSELVCPTPWRAWERDIVARLLTRLAAEFNPPTPSPPSIAANLDETRGLTEQVNDGLIRVFTVVQPAWRAIDRDPGNLDECSVKLKIDGVNLAQIAVQRRMAAATPPASGTPAPAPLVDAPATTVLMFMADVPQDYTVSMARLKEALQAGWSVCPVVLHSPFTPRDEPGGYQSATEALKSLEEEIKKTAATARPSGKLIWNEDQKLLLRTMNDTDAHMVAELLAERLKPSLDPRGWQVFRGVEGRFFDERSGVFRPLDATVPAVADAKAWTPPFWTQDLKLNGGTYPAVGASVARIQAEPGQAAATPLAAWCPLGTGQVICLAYSMFEGVDPPVTGVENAALERDLRLVWPPAGVSGPSVLGMQRALEPAVLTQALDAPPGDHPRIVALAADPATGDLEIRVVQRVDATRPPKEIGLRLTNVPPAPSPVSARLVDFDPSGTLTYLALARDIRKQFEAAGRAPAACVADLLLTTATGMVPVSCYLPAPAEPTADLGAWSATAMLAAYTGGEELIQGDLVAASRIDPRTLVHLALACALAYFLGSVVARRFMQRRRFVQALRSEAAKRYENTEGITGAAELLGRAVPNQRVGAYGGIRAFEPGDQLASTLRMDLLRLAGVVRLGPDDRVIPRVPLRIKEQTAPLHLQVQMSASMRMPRHGEAASIPAKIETAARAARLLAQVAGGRGAEVTVSLAGLAGDPPTATFSGDCGMAVYQEIVSRAAEPPSRERARPPSLPEAEGNVVYLSDFLMETAGEIAAWVDTQISEGRGVGGVLVYSPAELLFVEAGYTRSPFIWCHRGAWLPEDVALMHRQLRAAASAAFDLTKGGLCALTTNLTEEAIAETVANSLLVELLR